MTKTTTIKTKLFFKFLLYSGLIFSIVMPVINHLFGDKTEILKLIFESAFFGSISSWFYTTQHLNTLRSHGITELDEKVLNVKQVEIIDKSFSTVTLSDLLRQDTRTQDWDQVVCDSTIKIMTKKSAQSWGEIILIRIIKDQIKIESKPKLAITLFDSGKNLLNIKIIKDILDRSNA